MSDDRVVDAIENAANEAVIFQSEVQADALKRARKRRRAIEEGSVIEEEREVDGSDLIPVTGHYRSLMYLVRTLGLSYTKKNLENLSISDKYYARLSLNSIVDLEDHRYMELLGVNDEAVEILRDVFLAPPVAINTPENNMAHILKGLTNMASQKAHQYLLVNSFSFSDDNRKKLAILSEMYKVLGQERSFLQKQKTASEWTLVIKLWSPVLETLFEDTDIDLVWSDTKDGLFKVNLRLCIDVDGKLYDLSNVEFKKSGDARKHDAKALVEGKSILNKLIKEYSLNLEEAKKQKVVVVQICGLKAVFSEMRLVASGCYMPTQFGRTIKYPHNGQRAKGFAQDQLQQLFFYKDLVLREAKNLKNKIQESNFSLGSQSTAEGQSFIRQLYEVPKKATKWPKVNNDFFKV